MKRRAVYIVLITFSMISTAFSQSATARLYGTVFDPQRLVLPGVSIQVREVGTGILRNTISGAGGYYEVQGLLPGDFEVTWELPGFSTSKTQVHLEVNQQLKLDLDMKVGDIATSVVVNASPPLLNSHDAALGTVIDQQKMESLPLNGRHFLELSLLTPGVHTSHGAQMGDRNPLYWRPGQNSAISVGGGRSNSNNYLLDGTINTDPTFNTYVISLSPDVVREFQTQSGTYSAEFGTAGTGVINVVTKSGTNEFHGSLYEFIRNSVLDAREFTSPSKLPHFSQNQFGGSIGGPIQKEKAFFFGHYEGFRSVQGKSDIITVPLMPFRGGDFRRYTPIYDPKTTRSNPSFDPSKPTSPSNPASIRDQFPNNTIPPDRINPIALVVLQHFVPAPTFGNQLANNYEDNRAQRLNNDQYTIRVDRTLKNGSLFGRYSLSNEGGFTPENLPGFGAFHDNRVQNLTISHNWAISPRLINDLHVGLQRMRLLRVAENGKNGKDLVRELGIPGVGFGGPDAYGLPQFVVQGYTPFGDSLLATPVSYFDTMYQVGDSVAKTAGSHSLKFGGDVRRFRWNMLGFFQNRGFFSFSSGFTTRTASNDGTGNALASFLLGLPAIATRQAGIPSMYMRQTGFNGFLQDDWRVRRNLTINLGIRYEMVTPLKDIRKVLSNLDFVDGHPVAYLSGQSGYPTGLQFADKNNVAPRIGFAYSPGNQHFVVRGGYGVFYGMDDMNTWCNQVHNVPLVFPETNQSDNFIPSIPSIGFGPAILGKTVVSFTGLDPHGRTSYIQQYSLTLERQVGKNDLVQLGYAGSVGRKLQRAHLRNNATPAPGPLGPRRPFRTVSFGPETQLPPNLPFEVQSLTFPVSAINILENSANSSYNSGWVLWKHQLSHGLSILTNYTYSRNLTDAPAFRSPANEPELPQNNSDLAAEKALAGCHLSHRYVLSANYALPIHTGMTLLGWNWAANILGDWKIATIYQAQSGFPFTISVFGDTANAGSILNAHPIRANQLPGVAVYLPSDQRSGDHWFNTAAFAAPPAFAFGNVGRNTVIGPSLHSCDLALIRDLRLKEAHQLQFRAEFFNLLNHTNFNTPNRYVNTPQFGSVTESATPARQIQFALRYRF